MKQTLSKDPIFLSAFSIPGMDDQVAMQVTYIKRALEEMLPKIPVPMRGGINEFTSFFMNFITVFYFYFTAVLFCSKQQRLS